MWFFTSFAHSTEARTSHCSLDSLNHVWVISLNHFQPLMISISISSFWSLWNLRSIYLLLCLVPTPRFHQYYPAILCLYQVICVLPQELSRSQLQIPVLVRPFAPSLLHPEPLRDHDEHHTQLSVAQHHHHNDVFVTVFHKRYVAMLWRSCSRFNQVLDWILCLWTSPLFELLYWINILLSLYHSVHLFADFCIKIFGFCSIYCIEHKNSFSFLHSLSIRDILPHL